MAASIMLSSVRRTISRKQWLVLEQVKTVLIHTRSCSSIDRFTENSSIKQDTSRTLHSPAHTNTENNHEMNVPVQQVESLLNQMAGDEPITSMSNPYIAEARRCILCHHNVEIDYKNVRLLSQFVSPYTGRIYGRHITGLCIPMQKHIARLIKRARILAFMPYMHKDLSFYDDPKLFDPMKRR